MGRRGEASEDDAHVVETGLAVHGWLETGADPDDVPPGVVIVVAGWSDGPFDVPRPTRVYGALFEMQVDGGLLRVSLTADDESVSSGYGTPGDASLLAPAARPTGGAHPVLQPVGNGYVSGWRVDALLLRTDVAAATFGGEPVDIPPHGVVLLISGDRTPPTLELVDASGAVLASGTPKGLVDELIESGDWLR